MLTCSSAALKFHLRISVEFQHAIVLADVLLRTRRILTARRGAFSGARLRGEIARD